MEEIDTVCAADMLPVRAHEADAGADLKAARDVAIRRGDTAKVSTGVRVSIPEGCFGLLAARSSLCLRGTNARQVIVDELADTQTTVLDLTETTRTVHGEEVRGWECRECGQSCEEMYGEYEYCPHCGRKVVEP